MGNNKFLIHLKIAGKTYGLWINRNDEELAREATRHVANKIDLYKRTFSSDDVDEKDLLAMVTLQLSMDKLRLEKKNDTSPFTEKIQQLTEELELFLKDE
jgi:cell division protein ZapA